MSEQPSPSHQPLPESGLRFVIELPVIELPLDEPTKMAVLESTPDL